MPVEKGSIVIGARTTHQSHSLAWKRVVWFCTTCGAYAKACRDHKSTCHHVSDQCRGQPSGSGARVLKRLAKGEPPRHGMAWPLPELDESRSAAATLDELWPDKRGAKRSNKRTTKSP